MKYIISMIGILAFVSASFGATPTPIPTPSVAPTPTVTPTPERKAANTTTLGQQILWGVDGDGSYHELKCSTAGVLWSTSDSSGSSLWTESGGKIVPATSGEDVSLSGDLSVQSDATITGDIIALSGVTVSGNVSAQSTATIAGVLTAQSNIVATGAMSTQSDLTVTGNVYAQSDLTVTGSLTASSDVSVTGAMSTQSAVSVGGALTATTLQGAIVYDTVWVSADYDMPTSSQGKVIVVDTTSGDIELTLPDNANIPSDSDLHVVNILHNNGANDVVLKCYSGDTFAYGNTYFNLGSRLFCQKVGGLNDGSTSQWGILKAISIRASAHRDAAWNASNFSSATIIPWDTEAFNNQTELLVYTSGSSARYTVKTAGTYEVNYTIDIDSTGGSTWNALAQVYKNGSALESTQTRTGNYGSEDQSMSLPTTYIDLVADDYLDLRIDQNSLTGNLVHSMFNIKHEI